MSAATVWPIARPPGPYPCHPLRGAFCVPAHTVCRPNLCDTLLTNEKARQAPGFFIVLCFLADHVAEGEHGHEHGDDYGADHQAQDYHDEGLDH